MKIRADRRVGLLLGGVMLMTFVSIGATIALPAIDPSLDAEPIELSKEAAAGMETYREEGLWNCNAAYARRTAIDGEGATTPAHIAGQSPVMLGLEDVAGPTADAQAIADACGVKLSAEEVAAVQAFLDSRG